MRSLLIPISAARAACILLLAVLVSPASASLPGIDSFAQLVIRQFDLDHNSAADLNEWQNGTNDGFAEMDHDRDGSISKSEIEALKAPISEELGSVTASFCVILIEKILLTFDTNGDGTLSKSEYETGCASAFKKLDANHDSTITATELAELPQKLLKDAAQLLKPPGL